MRLRRKQRGFWQIIPAVIGAAAAAKGVHDQRKARLSNESQQAFQSELDYARQKEFAQNSIQWRVSDAKAAGLHPLYALTGGGSSYSPAPFQTFAQPTNYSGVASALGQIGSRFADYMESRSRPPGELYGPPDELAVPAMSYPISGYGDYLSSQADVNWQREAERYFPQVFDQPWARADYGMTSNVEKPSMAYWSIPEIGRVIAPDASNFSESLEGLESIAGQALILYLNRGLGTRALNWLKSQMPRTSEKMPDLLNMGAEIAREIAVRNHGITIRR